MIDAQTIAMCEKEKAMGRSGALGRNYIYMSLAQVIISPLIGLLMDVVAKVQKTHFIQLSVSMQFGELPKGQRERRTKLHGLLYRQRHLHRDDCPMRLQN